MNKFLLQTIHSCIKEFKQLPKAESQDVHKKFIRGDFSYLDKYLSRENEFLRKGDSVELGAEEKKVMKNLMEYQEKLKKMRNPEAIKEKEDLAKELYGKLDELQGSRKWNLILLGLSALMILCFCGFHFLSQKRSETAYDKLIDEANKNFYDQADKLDLEKKYNKKLKKALMRKMKELGMKEELEELKDGVITLTKGFKKKDDQKADGGAVGEDQGANEKKGDDKKEGSEEEQNLRERGKGEEDLLNEVD